MNEFSVISDIQLLQTGQIQLVGQVVLGSNITLLVRVTSQDHDVQAIYKPNQGERPLWDFPRYSLSKREVAAFVVSNLLSWDLVPPTVYRQKNAPYGPGSLQLFIPHDPNIHYFNLVNKPKDTIQKIILFDYLINNADRKGGHLIQDENQKLWLIDHGLSFSKEFKLRTVIWDYAGETIPKPLLNDLQSLHEKFLSNSHPLLIKLQKLLSVEERDALSSRIVELLNNPKFPKPEETRRSYPWPLI